MMSKYFKRIFIASLLVLFGLQFSSFKFQISNVFAQTPTVVSGDPQSDTAALAGRMCPTVTDEGVDQYNIHTYTLSASGLPVNGEVSGNPVPIYVLAGIATTNGTLLTTGDRVTDVTYGYANQEQIDRQADALSVLVRDYGYSIEYLNTQNPFHAASDGTASVKIKPSTTNEEPHTFFFLWPLETEVVGGQGGESSEQANSPAYATFRFQGTTAQCLTFQADPYGRVYNEKLRPIPGVTVSLFDSTTQNLYKLAGIPNPVTTREDGIFNFNIEPGTVFLRTNLQNNSNVHQNYALAYTQPYKYGDPIVETLEKAEQRDIPAIGGAVPVLKLMNYGHVQLGSQTRIDGSASWPLTIVDIMQGETSVAHQQSSKFGRFNFFINNAQIDQTKQLTIRLTEVDLLTDATQPAPGGKTIEESFDPIPRYLEGYAYDANGNLMPFATIQVKLVQSDAVYYQTKADGNAFFTVGPRNLPMLPFYVTYTPSNTIPTQANSRVVTIPEFVQENKEYLSQNSIHIIAATKKGKPVDPAAVVENIGTQSNQQTDSMTPEERARFQKQQEAIDKSVAQGSTQRNLTMVLLIVSFIFVSGGIVLYLKKRGMMEPTHEGTYTRESTDTSDEPEIES